jgi:hypothetical protein
MSDVRRPDIRYMTNAFKDAAELPFDVPNLSLSWPTYFEKAQIPT